ncbi:glucosamine-6-phosphate deaminase [Paracoccus aminophilus]|uniref:Glucosamine-6-phosphate deaminase n=1 Tax=Paracoccus aminophilus JCM 7686 TaxID=1367847 RepID=S5XV29_PARAH|nr:glucosamine-6-phosphate deaminase [Paracoccus aminophilus]AGT07185.1 glucosamine-6-phosphate isomerase [Paracoccus aminophilus JCM 7686]
MKILILDTAEAAQERAAEMISEAIRERSRTVLGLATGGTMLPVYERLVACHRAGKLSFSGVTTFNLDEYVGLAPSHPQSYRSYMNRVLFSQVDIDLQRTHLPRGDARDPEAEAARYEATIAQCGGLDLQLLGIGHNGHIGFNEPTSSLKSRTRIKTLTRETREANSRYFRADEHIPSLAITMGVGTILDARGCLLLAVGAGKAAPVAAMVEGPLAAVCPASALQLHPKATVILDRAAAQDLKLKDYYLHVHPDGSARDELQ